MKHKTLPLFSFYRPDIRAIKADWKTITIRWPKDSKIPTPRGKAYRFEDGRIQATYTREELRVCLEVFESIK